MQRGWGQEGAQVTVTGQRVRFQPRKEVDKGDLTTHECVFICIYRRELHRDLERPHSPRFLPLLPFHFIAPLSGGLIFKRTFLHCVGHPHVIYHLVTVQQTGKQTLGLLPFGWTERAAGRRAAAKRSGWVCGSAGATRREREPPASTPPAPAPAAPPPPGRAPGLSDRRLVRCPRLPHCSYCLFAFCYLHSHCVVCL